MKVPVSRTLAWSVVAVMATGLLCAVALARALTVSAVVPDASLPDGVASVAELAGADAPLARVPSEVALGNESLAVVADNDPFAPDRRRAVPYRLPGEVVERAVPTIVQRPVQPPPFRVIGTASAGSVAMALVQPLNSARTELVVVGGDLQGYTLDSVDGGSATLAMSGREFTLDVEAGEAGGTDGWLTGSRGEVNERLMEELIERGVARRFIDRIIESGKGGTAKVDERIFQFNRDPATGRLRVIEFDSGLGPGVRSSVVPGRRSGGGGGPESGGP